MVKPQAKIVLVPGWTYKLEKNLPLVDLLRRKGLTVEILLVPGLTGEKLTQAWTLNDYANWLDKQVSGKQEVILIGHSNGGRIILKYLMDLERSKKVKQVILIDSAGLIDQSFLKRMKRVMGKMIAKMGKRWKENRQLRKLLYRILREGDYERATPVMKETMANLIEEDLRGQLIKIKQPILLIWGEHDRDTPLDLGREMAQKLPRASLKIIEEARHTPQFTHPKAVANLIEEFINGKI